MSGPKQLRSHAKRAYRAGQPDLASELMIQAWDAAEAKGDHVICAEVAHSAADLFLALGQEERAERMAKRAVDFKGRTGVSDILLGNYLAFLAQLLGWLGRPEEGVPHAKRALEVFTGALGAENGETAIVHELLQDLSTQGDLKKW